MELVSAGQHDGWQGREGLSVANQADLLFFALSVVESQRSGNGFCNFFVQLVLTFDPHLLLESTQ